MSELMLTEDEIIAIFKDRSPERETGSFADIKPERRLHHRPDLNAFLLLDKLCQTRVERDMVSSASHDEIYLDVTPVDLNGLATREDILDLVRCGVRYSEDSFCMFA